MFVKIASTLIIASLYFTLITTTQAKLTTHLSPHYFPNDSVIYDSDSFDNASLAYAVCEKYPQGEDQKCRLVLDENSTSLSCDLVLKTGQTIKDGIFGPRLEVALLRGRRAMIVWWEEVSFFEYRMRIDIVSFHNNKNNNSSSCRLIKAKFDLGSEYASDIVKIVDHSSHYDLIFKNAGDCRDRFCKMSVDASGRLIERPRPWARLYGTETKPMIVSIAPETSRLGYLLIEGTGRSEPQTIQVRERWPASIVRADGTKIHLKNFTHGFPSFYDPVYSTAHGKIGICTQVNTTCTCSQFDHSGRTELEVKVTLEMVTFATAMHNLAAGTGGFLLLITDCYLTACVTRMQRHSVWMIGNSGLKIGELSFDKLDCEFVENLADVRLWETTEGEYCASFVCYKRDYLVLGDDIGHFNLTTVCFDDDDFLKI
ncbi:unnamed protein product [Trichogramma brassicae]|uniref:Signal peptide containing protein n=1 Tax=Trichogramma brassicae TaxID=86971 RepID=A0A6H5HWB0_9HYME|nr:unnamed protein product [Trichogramma brassicae]